MYLDVHSRLDTAAAQLAAREAVRIFTRAGDDIGRGLGANLSKAFGALDGGAVRREMQAMQAEFRRTADVEADSAARMVRSMGAVEVAQRRLSEMTAKYGADSSKAAAANVALADSHARAAKAQRDHVDAMVGAEGAAAGLATASKGAADEVGRAGQVFNAVGIASVAGLGAVFVDATRKAGDFQASTVRLQASAGETAQNLKTVSDGILQLAGQVGYSAQDLMNNMYGVEKAGYRGAEGVTVMKSAAQGAKSENAELGEVLNGLTTSMNDFHYSADQSADVMSKMVAATSMAKTNFQDFSGALHTAEPLTANIGKSQGLNSGQMQHLMADLYGVIAVQTQSGDSAEHSSQIYNHAMQKMLGPTSQMRDMMGALGLDAQDVQDHLGERGLAGTMQLLTQAVQAHTKDGKVNLDVHMQSAQLARAETEAFNGLSPAAKAVAQQIQAGTLSYKDFRKSRGGLSVEQANEVGQWNALNNKLTGFSSLIKSGIGDQISFDQALKILTGDQLTLQAALQTGGENTDRTNSAIAQIAGTTREADGTVKGFTETQKTFNAKMADTKAALGAAAIAIGNDFLPAATSGLNVVKDIATALSAHPGVLHTAITALEAFGGAWLTFKGIGIVETVLGPITRALGTMAEAEGVAATAAGGLKTALGFLGPVAAGLAIGPAVGKKIEDVANSSNWANEHIRNPVRNFFGASSIPDQKAGGGPLDAPGPKGKDSALFWGAKGEHVWTAPEVDAAGGHSAMYAMRSAVLHRQGGGAIGGEEAMYAEAQALNGGRYVWGSTDCSGAVSMLVDAAVGGSGRMSTATAAQWLSARGFQSGFQPGALNVGWYNGGPGGGHMAATLPDGTHFESGGQHGGIMLGGSAAGAETSEFSNHMYLPVEGLYPDGPGGGGGGFGGMGALGGGGGGAGGFGGGGGGGVPAGSTPGTGPGGQQGYYTPNQGKVAHAQEEVTHLQEEIKTLEERKATMKSTASQAEKDRLEESLRHEHVLLDEANGRLSKAQQGDFHAARGGRGGGGLSGGGPGGFGAPLPSNFGLGKGLPGLAEWLVTFLGDMAVAPIEAQMAAAAGMGGGSSPGGYADLGDMGTPFTGGGGFGGGAPDIPGPSGGGGPAMAVGFSAPSGGGAGAPSSGTANMPQAAAHNAAGWFGASPTPAAAAAPSAPGMRPLVPDWARKTGGMPILAPGQWNAPAQSSTGMPPNLGSMLVPGYAGKSPNFIPSFGDPLLPHLSTGTDDVNGPSGTDTVPAWLTPHEAVLDTEDAAAWRQAQHFVGGTPDVIDTAAVTPPPPPVPPPHPQGETPTGGGDKQQDKQQPLPGGGIGSSSSSSSKGLGISGGAVGAAEGAASMGADMLAPGSGLAVQMGSQMLNRTVAYGGQMAGIAVQGLLSTFLPSDSPLSDFGNTLPGKLLGGIAGAKPAAPQSAGNTQAPLKNAPGAGDDKPQGESAGIGMQINGMTVQASNADQFKYQMQQTQQQYQQSRLQVPPNNPGRG